MFVQIFVAQSQISKCQNRDSQSHFAASGLWKPILIQSNRRGRLIPVYEDASPDPNPIFKAVDNIYLKTPVLLNTIENLGQGMVEEGAKKMSNDVAGAGRQKVETADKGGEDVFKMLLKDINDKLDIIVSRNGVWRGSADLARAEFKSSLVDSNPSSNGRNNVISVPKSQLTTGPNTSQDIGQQMATRNETILTPTIDPTTLHSKRAKASVPSEDNDREKVHYTQNAGGDWKANENIQQASYEYALPAKITTTPLHFTTQDYLIKNFAKTLHRHSIGKIDDLQNYNLSRRVPALSPHNFPNEFSPNDGLVPIYGQLYSNVNTHGYNNLNHQPPDPFLALLLSQYGKYLPGFDRRMSKYNNLYGYSASNNIHNNKPFGAYKIYTDTDVK